MNNNLQEAITMMMSDIDEVMEKHIIRLQYDRLLSYDLPTHKLIEHLTNEVNEVFENYKTC